MFIPIHTYLKRIIDSLETVVAPEIDSDHVRGQAYALVDLVKQLADRVEYKQELFTQDAENGRQLIQKVLDASTEAGLEPLAELAAFVASLKDGSAGKGPALRVKTEEVVSVAIDFALDNRAKFKPEKFLELDAFIREVVLRMVGRDVGLMKPPAIEKISRSKKEAR